MYILVVEDDVSIRDILVLVANSAFPQAHVEAAGNGTDALRMSRDRRPDLMLLDLGLPDMTGFDVLAALNRDGRAGRTIIVTAEDMPDRRRRAQDLGADAFVTKPFDGRVLRKLMLSLGQEAEQGLALPVLV